MVRVLATVGAVLITVSGTARCEPRGDAAGGLTSEQRLKIIPWVELNYAIHDEYGIKGLLAWKGLTDTAIVSTRPGRAALYSKLRERVPGMRIIPGLKPNGARVDLLPTFDSVAGWQKVAEEVAAMCETSGQRVVLLDNEVAIKRYRMGKQRIELDRLRAGLEYLPKDIVIIWYPSIHSHTTKVQKRYADVCRVVADVCDVRFTDRSTETPAALEDLWLQRARRTLEGMSSRPTLPMLYAYAEDSGIIHWPDARIPDALEYVRKEWGDGAEVVIYPGVRRWVEAGDSIKKILQRPDSPTRP